MAVNLGIMNIVIKSFPSKHIYYHFWLFFIYSAKFSSKLRFVRSLSELGQIIPMEYIFVPELVQQWVQQPQGWIQDFCFLNSLRCWSKIIVFLFGHRGGSKIIVSLSLLYLKSFTRLDLMIVVFQIFSRSITVKGVDLSYLCLILYGINTFF